MKTVLTVALALSVVGCSPPVWIRPGTTQYQFSQDKAHCTKQSAIRGAKPPSKGKEPKVDEAKFEACMEALGYSMGSKSSSSVFY
jgi:hypothetical protein